MRYGIVALFAVLLPGETFVPGGPAAGVALGLDSAGAEEENDGTVQLVLDPAGEPDAALEFRFLPGILERIPSNAFSIHGRLALRINQPPLAEYASEIADLVEAPLEEMPVERVELILDRHWLELKDLKLSARCETYDWPLPPPGDRDFLSIRMDGVQEVREFARLLALEARLAILQGRYDEAVESLKAGYSLARQVGQGPTSVHGLVGLSVCTMMSDRVEELIGRPGAPNLYWALTALPRPMIDMRAGADFNMYWLYLSYPALNDVVDTRTSANHWKHLTSDLVAQVTEKTQVIGERHARAMLVYQTMQAYPAAKRFLAAEGKSPEEVEGMPVEQVVLLYMTTRYARERDRLWKWFYLPYWQAREEVEAASRELSAKKKKAELTRDILFHLLDDNVLKLMLARDRNGREIDVLRTIEAIRMYGANHDRRLPQKLDDCDVPVPLDPLLGRPFDYHLHGDVAVLEAQSVDPDHPQRRPRYEISFR